MKLKRHFEFVARVKIAGGGVNDEADATERGFALKAANHAVTYTSYFVGHTEGEFARVNYELAMFVNFYFFHHVVDWFFGINADVLFGFKN